MRKEIFTLAVLFIVALSVVPIFADYQTDDAYLDITLLNQDPDPAEPGKYVELRWKVQKSGNYQFSDITFTLEPEYPFLFDKSDSPEKKLGDWKGFSYDDEYYTLYYKLYVDDAAVEGTYDLKLTYTTKESKIASIPETFQIRVDEANIPVLARGSIVTSPSKLFPDTDENKLDIDINNVGEGNAEDVHVKMVLPDGFTSTYSYSDEDNLGNIDSSKSATATFYIDIDEDIASGYYDSELILTYSEDDENEILTKVIPIKLDIKNKPTFDIVDVQFDKQDILPGDTVKVAIGIKNIGNRDVESVSVRAFKDSSQPFDFDEKSDFIGTLDPGTMGQAILVFDVEDDAEDKPYIVDIEIRSIDNDVVFIQEETITIDVDERKGNALVPIIISIILIVVVLAAVFFLGVNYASRDRKKKSNK
ncbi:hypothetical protein H6503_05800 [Candidatus Woesearchaeota archaeon]|nr:hypothetical protein [Candidatus Woesearchaeota archaeon]